MISEDTNKMYEDFLASAKNDLSEVTTVDVGFIGRTSPSLAGRALDILKPRKSRVATEQIYEIGISVEEQACPAIKALGEREDKEVAEYIRNIVESHLISVPEAGDTALEVLKDRKDEAATNAIGWIGCYISDMGQKALNILDGREDKNVNFWIVVIGCQVPGMARIAQGVLKKRGDEDGIKVIERDASDLIRARAATRTPEPGC